MPGSGFAAEAAGHVEGHLKWLREVYWHFHRLPELSMEEHRTADRIEQELTSMGLDPLRLAGMGVVAVIENGPGPTVLARADTDALPLQEDTGFDFRPVMHACGYDAHAAALLGAVWLLSEHRDAWSGTYIAVFQPGEETTAGARAMFDNVLLDRIPRPDVALLQHLMPTPAGTIGTVTGPVISASNSRRITIPDRAELLLNIRTYDLAVRDRVMASIERIERIVRSECTAADAPLAPKFELYDQYPFTSNDAQVADTVTRAFAEHFGPGAMYEAMRVTVSEDFSRIPDAFGVPYTYWTVGSVNPARYCDALARGAVGQEIPANHSPHFAPLEAPTLLTATRARVMSALAYLARDNGK